MNSLSKEMYANDGAEYTFLWLYYEFDRKIINLSTGCCTITLLHSFLKYKKVITGRASKISDGVWYEIETRAVVATLVQLYTMG